MMSHDRAGHWDNGSFWFDSIDIAEPEAPATLPVSTDVVIIGAGYTGLWTAYYLNRRKPELDITIIEANTVGFGASGRNGGWCMGTHDSIERLLHRDTTREAGLKLVRAMQDTVDEVGRVCQAENIDCHFSKGGTLTVATTEFHAHNLEAAVGAYAALGFESTDHVWLDAEASKGRLNMSPNYGAMYTPHCAAIHPARLVRGLGELMGNKGVRILEQTAVTGIRQGEVHTNRGDIRARTILRATEGYTDSIAGQRRQLLPLYSMMIATEPLPAAVWEEIGLHERETFGDCRRVVIYGQRTLDNRLAFGSRAGYYFNSRMKPTIDPGDRQVREVERTMRELFPMLAPFKVTHGWGGLMGAPRNWRPYVHFDASSGFGAAGGYVGEGVGASNLAGRILADLAAAEASDLTNLDWVGPLPPRWEPEPLRWMGASAIQWFGDLADRHEFRTGRPSKLWGGIFSRFV